MRLIDADEFAKDRGLDPKILTSEIRARLVEVRPSALEARGEPPLCEVGSLVYGLSDYTRSLLLTLYKERWTQAVRRDAVDWF